MTRLAHARHFVLAALAGAALAGSLPAQAQVRVAPSVGYDADVAAPSVRLGAEVPLAPSRGALALAVRPSAEVVFSTSDAVAYLECGVGLMSSFETPRTTDTRFLRLGADLVGRYRLPATAVAPYATAGLVLERTLFDGLLGSESDTNLGAALGLGVEAYRLFAEATVGTAAVSTARFSVGVRF